MITLVDSSGLFVRLLVVMGLGRGVAEAVLAGMGSVPDIHEVEGRHDSERVLPSGSAWIWNVFRWRYQDIQFIVITSHGYGVEVGPELRDPYLAFHANPL